MRRVLVTGVGGAPGFDLTRTLLQLGYEVVVTDADPFANGLQLPGVIARVAYPANSDNYAENLLSTCRETRPDAILPTVEAELPQLISLQPTLNKLGVSTWLPEPQAVRACSDKAEFHRVLTDHHLPTPQSWLPEQIEDVPTRLPLVIKPRHGQGSQNVMFCESRLQARALCQLIPDPLIQTRVQGREFTADCLVDRDGQASVILRYRLLTKGGLSIVGETFHDQRLADTVTATLTAVGITGLCCAQGFLIDDPATPVLMTEINARIAGGFTLAEAAGADLVRQTIAGLHGQPVTHDRLRYHAGVRLTRYTETLTIHPTVSTPRTQGNRS